MNKAALLKRGLYLEYMTLGWNVVGVGIVLIAAWRARSVALAGFGLDSLIEIFASLVVVWELNDIADERRHHALRMIGIAFLLLALYILGQSAYTLLIQVHPAPSVGGIVWVAATLGAMLLLAWGKKVTGDALNNPVLKTEGNVTLVDALSRRRGAGRPRAQCTLCTLVGRSARRPGHCLLWPQRRLACLAHVGIGHVML